MEELTQATLSAGESRYRAYLVRLWQDGSDVPWRALARDAETGEECRFATIEQLFLFLHRQTESAGRTGRQSDREGGPFTASADRQPEGESEENRRRKEMTDEPHAQ